MYHGIRLLLDVQRDFVVVKIDLKNAFNAVDRKAILEALANVPEANVLFGPLSWKCLGQKDWPSRRRGRGSSEESAAISRQALIKGHRIRRHSSA